MEHISSSKHPDVVLARSLATCKGRVKSNQVLIETEQALSWALKSNLPIDFVLISDKVTQLPIIETLEAKNIPCSQLSQGILDKIKTGKFPSHLVAVATLPHPNTFDEELVIILDHLQDFGNIGTIVRTGAALDIRQVGIVGPTRDLYSKKAIDASRGTCFKASQSHFSTPKEAIAKLKASGYQIIVTSLDNSKLLSTTPLQNQKTAIIFGNETEGTSQEWIDEADHLIQIPMVGELDSLNVGVAAGISLYELKSKMVLTMLKEKIQGSLGRNLSVASHLLREAFDQKLTSLSPIDSEQAICLMIMAIDTRSTIDQLARDTRPKELDQMKAKIQALLDMSYLAKDGDQIVVTPSGNELLAKIWLLKEEVDCKALQGFTKEEKSVLQTFLNRIQNNLIS
ncbi:MAG: tRNA (guanosine(18)-2'-O)-methyltransferase [Chlamydiia bacterium]|nr:tRNA (guanosine(18)-2'-O)-methyltransferase [Chlamydiia bacterium]